MTGLVIIEGVDGSGKTTLIEGLRGRIWIDYMFNFTYPKLSTPRENMAFALGEYMASTRIFAELIKDGRRIICDRFHVGEYAYGTIFRKYEHFEVDAMLKKFEEYLVKQISGEEIKMIILLANSETSTNRIKAKGGDDYVNLKEDLSRINARYSIYHSDFIDTLVIATDTLTPKEVLKLSLDFILKKGDEYIVPI